MNQLFNWIFSIILAVAIAYALFCQPEKSVSEEKNPLPWLTPVAIVDAGVIVYEYCYRGRLFLIVHSNDGHEPTSISNTDKDFQRD